jgi:hypothetical protein
LGGKRVAKMEFVFGDRNMASMLIRYGDLRWRHFPRLPDNLKFQSRMIDLLPEKPPVQALVECTKRTKTTFRKRQITRIVKGIKASKATGTFEFHLDDDLVRFHLAGESDAPVKAAEKVNPWDKVLKNGKAKPALTLLKKVP